METIRNVRTLISGAIAVISCPCHLPATLPLLLAVTAGTSVGVWIANNTFTLGAIVTIIFFASLGLTFYWSKQPDVCDIPEGKSKKSDKVIMT